jgi:hypothetical protein
MKLIIHELQYGNSSSDTPNTIANPIFIGINPDSLEGI